MTATATKTWLTDDRGNRASVEYWLPVPGYRGSYEVSTSGRVRSCERININVKGVRRLLRGKVLNPSIDSEGYYEIGLLRFGKEIKARIHRLVALAFVKNPLTKPLVDHVDRQRLNNTVANIRWATFVENRQNSAQNTRALADMKALAEREPAAPAS